MLDMTYTDVKALIANDAYNYRTVIERMKDQPAWITEKMDWCQIQGVIQGGCESGAYMPAVTYYQANVTMFDHGDDVLDYIEEYLDELPTPDKNTSWSGMAVLYLSTAVELWCSQFVEYSNWS